MCSPAQLCLTVCILFQLLLPNVLAAQDTSRSTPIVIRADQPYQAPGPASFQGGTATSPHGDTIGMNARYLTLDGKPWLPVMGEFHYTRVPESQWEDEILKMKAAGVQIVSTYVIWIHQEEVEGQFDWSGRRDLRHFVELCARHGMYVWLRIGPWDHGEVRNGGFPDWLLQKVPKDDLRRDDPIFMHYVRQLYGQIGDQVRGLTWGQGGPILGVQLENEYSLRGPNAGAQYILALKKLALSSGLDVPIYSVTGWNNAVVPADAVVAVFSGYPATPWVSSIHQLPPSQVYVFRFGSRVTGDVNVLGSANQLQPNRDRFPFMTAEMGGGIEDYYSRRPVIQPNDIAAMMPVMLGSGVNLYGTYMFQGGENPNGKRTTLQESQATGYPNDAPVKSYDFQAPLSEFGEEREVLRKLKVFNYFLNDFGSELAPMVAFAPARLPANPQDLSVARVSVRTDGKSGFLFFNNYVRGYAMPDRPDFQVRVQLPGRELSIPDTPVDLPSGAYGIWPFGMVLGGLHLRYATAELFSKTADKSGDTYYFVATVGVAPQFVFEDGGSVHLETNGKQEHRDGAIVVSDLHPALDPAIVARGGKGRTTRIVILSQEEAENAWKLQSGGSEHLLLTPDQFFANGPKVTLQRDGSPEFHFTVVPPISRPSSAGARVETAPGSRFTSVFLARAPKVAPRMVLRQVQQAGVVPPVKLGWRGTAMAPEDKEFTQAAKWKIVLPEADWKGVDNLFLQIRYDGDIARLTSSGELLDDNFYNGEPWRVGLDRFRKQIAKGGLQLEILPRCADAPIFLERRDRDAALKASQIDQLRSIELVPQYRLDLEFRSER